MFPSKSVQHKPASHDTGVWLTLAQASCRELFLSSVSFVLACVNIC